jgi:nitroreductase
MEKAAHVQFPIHNLLKHRWSPRAFSDRDVDPALLRSLFEAARWAASSSNGQPWSFIVATRKDSEAFQRVLSCFVEFNAGWAKHAPVIGISVARLHFETNGNPNRHAYHDVGQAMANLAIEAVANGLQLHQMAGIEVDKTREALSIPQGYDPVAGFALGYPGEAEQLPDQLRDRELAQRERKPAEAFVYEGKWGQKSPLFQQ